MGVKPLYYYGTPDGVLFGSEAKAILASPLAERTVSLDGLREMFAWIKTPGQAVYDGMREVEPGTVVTVGYVRDLLEDIVARQMIADVPQCTLLSGGLDSSAMTAIAAKHLMDLALWLDMYQPVLKLS